MTEVILAVLLALTIFFALVINIAKNSQSGENSKLSGISLLFAIVGGVTIYGYGYASSESYDVGMAIIRTLLSTFGMFLGKNDYKDIADGPYMQNQIVQIIFWLSHLLAFYATTNAFLATIGAKALKKLRVWIRKFRNKIVIIYGINDHTIALGNNLSQDKDNFIIFIDKNVNPGLISALNESELLYYITNDAVSSSHKFLEKIGAIKGKKIAVYALSNNETDNFNYAINLRNAFENTKVEKERISLTMLANMEMKYGEALQAYGNKYGYGSVKVVDKAYLAASTLVKTYPPCNYVEFDTSQAKAVEGEIFNAVIIGFGRVGQAVLKNIVINGQFEGCDFKVTVFDPKHTDISGYLYKNSKSMMENYNIDLRVNNAKEKNFFEFIEKECEQIDYIVVCTGDVETNAEITGDIQSTIKRFDGHAEVFQCSYDEIINIKVDTNTGESKLEITNLYTKDTLDIAYADNIAMSLNHIYCGGESKESDWSKARFLDRMSCHASANFAPAFLKMAGYSRDDVLYNDKWKELSEIQLLNLSKTEHLRWCAFYYSLGYVRMPDEIFNEKCEQYMKDVRSHGSSKVKIQKEPDKYLHACLVDWDDLDKLSERYREVTGDVNKDYKKDDTNNVIMLADVLRASNM